MAEGGWVVLGAAIGSFGSILTTWLASYLGKKPPDPFDAAALALLRKMLEGEHQWRNIDTLANVVGLDNKTTKEYLVVLGARGSELDGKMWGLLSRNPIKDVNEQSIHIQ